MAADRAELSVPEALALLSVELSDDQLALLARYRDLLLEANERMNLTALKSAEAVDSRLVAESLALIPQIGPGPHTLIDVGTGGGVPGLPLAIAMPDSTVVLLDSTAKKLAVVDEMIATLGLDNAQTIHGRAEELAHDAEHRGCYTVVVSRAVARLPVLVEYTLPFLQRGGMAVLPKGQQVEAELREAMNAIDTLGGRLLDLSESPVNGARFVRIAQKRRTPARYPRTPGTPTRQPIGVSTR